VFRPYPPSPEDLAELETVAEGYRAAMARREWQRAGQLLTDKGLAQHIAIILFGSFYEVDSGKIDRDSFMALLERHGLPTNTRSEWLFHPGLPLAFAELIEWLGAQWTDYDILAQLSDPFADARFEDFRMLESGQASATLVHGDGRRQNARFEKTDQGWRMTEY